MNVKLSNFQLNKLKYAIKSETDVVLRLSLNMISNSDDKTNFPHKLLLTNRKIANLRKVTKKTSTEIKFSKNNLSKIMQLEGRLGRLLGPLLKAGLPLIKNVIQPLAKSFLITLELTSAALAAGGGIHKKILGSGHNTTLAISNGEMKDILKIVESLENSGLLLKGVSETIKKEAKEQKGGFLSILLGILGASLIGNMLTGKGVMRAGEGTFRVGYGSKKPSLIFFLIPPHPLTNFEIQMYYQNEPKFNGVYSKDNLPDKIKDGAYVIKLHEYSDIGTHWIALYVNTKTVTYFDSCGVEHIPKEIKKIVSNKNIIKNIFRIQEFDLVMSGYFCIGFIDFILKDNN